MSGNAILLAPYNEGNKREFVGPVNRSEKADFNSFRELTMTTADDSQFWERSLE
jgi:hypothetical protein